jgi:hypothetical protein
MLKSALGLLMVLIFAGGCGGSDHKFTSLSGSNSISRINRDYEKNNETAKKKREEREKNARDHSRATREDDASNFPDKRTEEQQFIEK